MNTIRRLSPTIIGLLIILVFTGCTSAAGGPATTVTETVPTITTVVEAWVTGPLNMDVTSPLDGRETTWGFTKVKGTVVPGSAVVEIENQGYARVSADGVFESDYILLDEGVNEITVTAMTGEETLTKTVSVTCIPDLSISLSPDYPHGKNWLTDYPEVWIKGRVSDPRAEVTVNGHDAMVDDGGYIRVSLQLEEGINTLIARAVLGDRTAVDTQEVAYKREETLVLSDFSLKAGQRTRVEYLEVTGRVNDPEADVIITSGVSDGKTEMGNPPWHYAMARVSASGYFTGYIELTKGKNEVTVTAHRGDDRSVASATVEYRPPLVNFWSTPDLEITSPVAGEAFTNNIVMVSGAVDEADATVLLDGLAADVDDDGSFRAYAVLEETGENTIEVVSFNSWKTDIKEISVTFEPPLTVSLWCQTEPDADHTREPMTVTGAVNKPEATVTINGEHVAVRNDGYFIAQVLLDEGGSTIRAEATLGEEQSSHYMVYSIENGQPIPAPGQGLVFGPWLTYDREVTVKEGETIRLPLTLETRKGGPGWFSGGLSCVLDEYNTMPIDWPEGLEVYIDPPEFTAYPDTVYEFDLVITASKGCSVGTYLLTFHAQMEQGFYTEGGLRVTVE